MIRSTRLLIVASCWGVLAAAVTASGRQNAAPLTPLVLPAGFLAEVFAENVDNDTGVQAENPTSGQDGTPRSRLAAASTDSGRAQTQLDVWD